MKPQKINTTDQEEAYKQLDGAPAGDAVSKAAQGQQPMTAFESEQLSNDDKEERLEGKNHNPQEETAETQGMSCSPQDLEDAYSQLFGALSVIMKSK